MLKKGFTLAEVLITLTIIGVVSALTLPSLLTDTSSAQVGPKLAKARSTFEQANQALLHEENVDGIMSVYNVSTEAGNNDYIRALTNHMRAVSGIKYEGVYTVIEKFPVISDKSGKLLSNDGAVFVISPSENVSCSYLRPSQCLLAAVYVDINGQASPNVAGTDLFAFTLWNDGSLKPVGSVGWFYQEGDTWETECSQGDIPVNALYCTGHVFENDLKVLYN